MNPYEAKKKYRNALMTLPNVVGVGVGPKSVAGKLSTTLAVKVYVLIKVPLEQLSEKDRIPMELEGVPTDVEEQAPLRAR